MLVNMMSIGTLLAYSIVAACVLILRYEESEAYEKRDNRDPKTIEFVVKQLINKNRLHLSTKLTSKIVTWLVFIYVVLCFCLTGIISQFSGEIMKGTIWPIALLIITIILLSTTLILIYLQPVSEKKLSFSVPLIPFLPAISILINIYLMVMLDVMTWIRFIVWMVLGLLIYFFYGVWHSTNRRKLST